MKNCKRFFIRVVCLMMCVALTAGLSGIYPSTPAFAQEGELATKFNTTYYIDDVNGSDTNDGLSEGQAWQSLDRVNSTTFQPGDAILFKSGGKWTGQLWPKGSGTEGLPITIGKYGDGNLPLIQGEGNVESVVYLFNQEYWEIGHLEITNYSSEPASKPRRGVHIAAQDYGLESGDTPDLSKVSVLNHIKLHDLYIHDVNGEDKKDGGGSAGIQVSVHIPGLVNNYPVEGSVHQRTTFNNVIIENNIVDQVSRSGIILWNDWKSREILGEDIGYGNSKYTPWTPITNVIIRGNKVSNIGGDGIVPHMTDGALVEYNVVDGFNQTSAGYNVGLWTWDGDNTLYQFNEVSGGVSTRDGNAFDFDHGSRGIIYQYNYSHDNEGGTLLICADGRAGGVYDNIFRYNISQNDLYQTFTICGGSNIYNTQIYNNVFYVGEGIKNNMLVTQGGNVEVFLYNNIFYNLGTGGYTKKPSWTYHNNAFFGKVPSQSEIPDPFMITADPMFENPGNAQGIDSLSGYQLKKGSPLINAGRFIYIDKTPGVRDYFNNPLYNGAPDVGAHEFQDVKYPDVKPFFPVVQPPKAEIVNPGFENVSQHANMKPWNWQWNAKIVKDAANAYEGEYAGTIAVNGGGSIEQSIKVLPNTTYKVSAYGKLGDVDQTTVLGVKFGNVELQEKFTSTSYEQKTVEFTTGPETTSGTIYFYKSAGSAEPVYVDNFEIKASDEGETVEVPVNKIALETLITDGNHDLKHENGQYSKAAIKEFRTAIHAAEAVLEDVNATQATVDAAAATLKQAYQEFQASTAGNPGLWIKPKLKVTEKGSTSFVLTWTGAADEAINYKVYLDGEELGQTTEVEYKVTGLDQLTKYTFKVEAQNANGQWSNDGPEVTAKTMPAASKK
jgi:Fibronectin type III domain